MALSISEVAWSSTTRLAYLINQSGNVAVEQIIIPNAGGASPDLRTDALAGVAFGPAPIGGMSLLKLLRARLDGYGPIPPGPLTQGQARALLMGWDMAKLTLTNPNIVYATITLTGSHNTDPLAWGVDVNVNASGDPVIVIESQPFGQNVRGQLFIEMNLHI